MDSNQAKKLSALLKKLRSQHEAEAPPTVDPVTQMVLAFLAWEASTAQADEAFGRIMAEVVDLNDLRISFEHEILDMVGHDYPLAEHRIARMREALQEIYIREYAVEMRSIAGKGKREQKSYVESLPGVPPYVAAQVMLLAFGAHALPVDWKLVTLLAREGVVDENTPPADVESQLLRQIKADEATEAHLLLQAWADEHEVPEALEHYRQVEVPTAVSPTSSQKPTRKSTKRTTSRRAKKK